MKFLIWIKSLLKETSYQDNIEAYLATKRPNNTAELELWIKNYHRQNGRNNFI